MNLVINCSSDRLQIWIGSTYHELPNRGLEMDFPAQLIHWIEDHQITKVFVINGPGSFTTLRVVCLTINLYISTHPGQIQLYHCTKSQLYHHLIDPTRAQQIYIYIGQRNNVWLYDLSTDQYQIVPKSDIMAGLPIDDVSDTWTQSPDRVQLTVEGESIKFTRYDQSRTVALEEVMTAVPTLYPHYLMEPNIG